MPSSGSRGRLWNGLQDVIRVGDEGLRCLLADPKMIEEGRG